MKVKVRFLFHCGKDSFVGKAITLWTGFLALFYNWKCLRFNYSHEECWLPNTDGGRSQFEYDSISLPISSNSRKIHNYTGDCFSSTTRGKWKGVRFYPAGVVLKHPERWDYIECEVDADRLEVAIEEAKRLVGLKYDYWGIFGFLNPFPIQDKMRWYCSEICDWFKVLVRLIPKRHKRISPRRAAYVLSKKWGLPKKLNEK